MLDLDKISAVESILNLGRKLKINKSGSVLKSKKNTLAKVLFKKTEPLIKKEESQIISAKYLPPRTTPIRASKIKNIDRSVNSKEDLERYLNEDMDPIIELAAMGAEIKKVKSKPRYKNIKREMWDSEPDITPILAQQEFADRAPVFQEAIAQINQKIISSGDTILVGEPKRVDVVDWWEQKKASRQTESFDNLNHRSKANIISALVPNPKLFGFSGIKVPKLPLKKIIIGGLIAVVAGFSTQYGFFLKREIILSGNSAVANLQNAGANIKNLDFDTASADFTQAYSDFAKAGDSLNFLGETVGSLIADLPGAGQLKAANDLVGAGKLIADAGQAMSRAINELAKTGLILNPTPPAGGSNVSIGSISKNLKEALLLSQKNIRKAKELLKDIDADSIPEDKRASLEEFQSKLPEFEKLVNDAVDYTKFLEDFIGISGTKKYLLLFQNPAELRPTGGFPGSYGVIIFKDGKLQDLRVDDVYNLDGQLKELIVPPTQLQHITPNWGMRDANWFVDFPTSARKVSEFYKKESDQDVDGVITFSPTIIAEILKITGPIEMSNYGVTLNTDNFIQTVQEQVEYKGDRAQPKKILVDLAPLMLKKIYSVDSEKWMDIFNIFVSSVGRKDILMYFRDLKLQDFSVTKGFSGQVSQTKDDYLMVTLSNIKGSKTDSVMDSELKVDTVFEGDDVRHKITITRTHTGGSSKYGFYNKQNSVYVRVLVPDNAGFLSIAGNSKFNPKPLLDYAENHFNRDEDLVRFEEKSYYDSETGITTYEESGKMEYGFWMITDPGETETIELEYRVPGKATGGEYAFYLQKQPGLEFDKFTLNLISDTAEIGQSSEELKKTDGRYTFSGKLDGDFPIKVIFK